MLSAVRAGDMVLLDVFKHLLLCHAVGMGVGVEIVYKIVGAVTHFALLAV